MDSRQSDVIAVDPALLKRFMLDDIYERATARAARPLPAGSEQLLDADPNPGIARAGYLTRLIETERFEAARQPMPWLSELLEGLGGDSQSVAAELSRAEPPGKPAPTDPAARTWQVPGPGGHVRYFLAARWAEGDEERRRSWLYGFFVRCCEESR